MENSKQTLIYNSKNPIRLDIFLTKNYTDYSRSYFQNLLKNNKIYVNSSEAKANYLLKENDKIEIIFETRDKLTTIEPENIELDIIFEDEHLIAVNKPANLVVHPACGNYSGTLVNALVNHFSSLPIRTTNPSANDWIRPGLVHRLDKETSGIILVAKTEEMLQKLAKLFEKRKIKKTYLAICLKNNNVSQGIIDIPISRSSLDRKKMAVAFPGTHNAKEARTYFCVKKELKNNFALVEASPETGRTHQIRVHLAHVGLPILGDTVYGVGNKKLKNLATRTLLHSKSIEFFHPITKKNLKLEANLTEDFEKILKELE